MRNPLARRTLVALVLASVPALLPAQAKMRGERSADWDKINNATLQSSLKLSNRDVENMSPMKRLIEKRKDLSLTDEQVQQYKGLESKLNQQNERLMKTLDSLRNEMKPSGRHGDDELARLQIARTGVTGILTAIRANYDATAKSALPLLNDGQRKTATDLLAAQGTEFEDLIREKLGRR